MAVGPSGLGDRAEAYAALVRVPNLFTAPPDVILGGALVAAAGEPVSTPRLAGLALASVALYAGGTVLNDHFDASVDATERPERPIPSGRVSRSRAGALGAVLLVAGVTIALAAAGPRAGALAALLAVVVALYDGVLKGGFGGFVAMGSARGLNVLLGVGGVGLSTLSAWAVVVPLVVTLYVAFVTHMAATEARETSRRAIATAATGAVVAVLAVGAAVVGISPSVVEAVISIALAGGFLAWTGRALGTAYADPRPGTVGPAVGTCVLGLVVLDAAFAALAGGGWALVTLAFLAPALSLARLFDVS